MAVSISIIFSLFLLFWLKKNELVSVIALYSEKLQLEKAAYAIVFEVTEKWKKKKTFSLGTTLDLLISFLRKQMLLIWKYISENI